MGPTQTGADRQCICELEIHISEQTKCLLVLIPPTILVTGASKEPAMFVIINLLSEVKKSSREFDIVCNISVEGTVRISVCGRA